MVRSARASPLPKPPGLHLRRYLTRWRADPFWTVRYLFAEMAEFSGEALVCVRGERQVFAGVHFRVASGDALVLAGPNGAGKTSLLRLMAGLAPAAGGVIAWDRKPIADDPDAHRTRVHYVGHLDAVKATLTVAENVAYAAELRGAPMARTRLAQALSRFGLESLADLPARYLSQGQRRRAALARLLAAPAALWLLDEPTLALDAAAQEALAAAFAEHRRDGGLVVVATHAPIALAGAATLELGPPG